MRDMIIGLSALGLCLGAAIAPAAAQDARAAIAAAVADPARPAADKARDAARKPADMLAFAGIGPGKKVAEFAPGGGYFTRMFARAVGPTGKVYPSLRAPPGGGTPAIIAVAAEPGYAGVITPMALTAEGGLTAPEKVDVVWTSRNYHDLGAAAPAFNKSVFDLLKPGGLYIVLDHSAGTDGAPDAPSTLHRINPELAKKEVLAAGFQFVAESDALRNPQDSHKERVFEQGIRDHTDQFILKFRKP